MNKLLIICLLAGCSTWTKKEITAESLFLISHAVDYKQTRQIAVNNKYKEGNPLLGLKPSKNRINNFFIGTSIGHVVFSNYLESHRYSFQKITLGIKLGMIGNNYLLDVKTEW